ncbi:Pentachlorophenol 4-monooxygenase [Aquisphaera giovannonii]|uniref:Pentachlorophenol 4-monooxygenase n=1 Tax=Aquisphaera giovannonii TaxID=406548 RepID=A0A5B9WEF3_9BACT|nr:FAD-dependent monooxygenase [Aquisphaera giovannonii]QEH39038.1 Pentachlorophenol 4-monooxygenase [Aquisphaera giovannonii]
MKPVLIVGAGPVGMTLASELTRYGVPVRIVDRAAHRTDKSRALVLWSRTLELLDRGGEGSAPFLEAGFRAVAVNIVAGKSRVGRIDLDGVPTPYPFALMLPQSETERLLEERLRGQGVAVERRVELASFRAGDDGVDAVLRDAEGREEGLSVDWMAGCDGAHSAVRHGLDAPFAGETMDADWMLADVHVTGYPCPDSEVSVYWHRDGILVIFPITPGRYRVVADLPPAGTEHPPTPTLEQVQAILDDRGPGGMKAADPVWLSGFRINGRKVASYRHGRVFLAGDAAHVHSPAGGQGMNTGMQDAFNLAWKLAMVARGTCAEHLLGSYSPERSAVGDEVLKAADRLTAVGTLRNPVAQTLRNLAGRVVLGLGPVRHAIAEAATEVTVGYPHGPLNGPAGAGAGPKPGERVAPITGRAPVGSGTAPLFALFADATPAADLVPKYPALLDPDVRPPLAEGGLWLVRPDGYLACSAREPGVIAAYLNGLARPAAS